MSIHSVRIVVFAKPDTEVIESFKSRKISFVGLVDVVTEEFAEMASGLVSNVILESLAQIRKNTFKILSRFSADLDAPYLTHRALHTNPEDAEDQLTALVAGELQAILEECQVTKEADLEKIEAWIADKRPLDNEATYLPSDLSIRLKAVFGNKQLNHRQKFSELGKVCADEGASPQLDELQRLLDEPTKAQTKLDGISAWFDGNRVPPFVLSISDKDSRELTREQLINLLRIGVKDWLDFNPDFSKSQDEKAHKFSLTNLFLNHNEDHDLDDKFATVTTLRSFYDQGERRLTLGTIVKHNDSFWVCIQPKCDTYRIEETRIFPFLPLTSPTQQHPNFDVIVWQDNQYRRLLVSQKPYDLKLLSFEPNEKKVIGTTDHIFTDIGQNEFKWVGELRSEQAQRLANRFAAELSRVGVNESQWLRRWSSKS